MFHAHALIAASTSVAPTSWRKSALSVKETMSGKSSNPPHSTIEPQRKVMAQSLSLSWTGLSRPSTSCLLTRRKKDVDARIRGHDGGWVCRVEPSSQLSEQALRPDPQHCDEQPVDDHVLVDRPELEARERLDEPDQEAGDHRARHAAEAAERHHHEGGEHEGLADRRRERIRDRHQRA